MGNRKELCIKCQKRIRELYPCGKTVYIGKRVPIDHQQLSELLRKKIPAEELALKFGVTVRRIQQIAALRVTRRRGA